MPLITLRVAHDAKILRRFEYALKLQARVVPLLLALVAGQRLLVRIEEEPVDRLTHSDISNDDKPPRLHQAYRRCVVRGIQQFAEQLFRHWLREETPAHISALTDCPVDSLARTLIKTRDLLHFH